MTDNSHCLPCANFQQGSRNFIGLAVRNRREISTPNSAHDGLFYLTLFVKQDTCKSYRICIADVAFLLHKVSTYTVFELCKDEV